MEGQELAELRQIVFEALLRARSRHNILGANGKTLVADHPNQFGDIPTIFDIAAEEAVIGLLRKWCEARSISIRIISEEHGVTNIGHEDAIVYTIWLDGCDGSRVYLESAEDVPNAGYGTVIAVAEGDNPRYEDVVFSAILRPDTDEIMYREGSGNTRILNLRTNEENIADGSHATTLDDSLIVFSDSVFEPVRKMFDEPLNKAGVRTHYTATTCGNAFRILARDTVVIEGRIGVAVAMLEQFDKANIELVALYHLAKGTYADMYAVGTGSSIGPQYILTFGQDPEAPEFFILAANPGIAGHIMSLVCANKM